MQGVRGSNPLSSTPGPTPSPPSTAARPPAAEPAVRPVAPQRRLARTGPGHLRPDLLNGALARAEPKALRYRLWHTAAPGGPPRPPPDPAPAAHLALVSSPGPRVRPAASSTCAVDRPGPIWPCPAGSRRRPLACPWYRRRDQAPPRHQPSPPNQPARSPVDSQHSAADPPLRPRRPPPAPHEETEASTSRSDR